MEMQGDQENWNYSRNYSSSFHGVFGISQNEATVQIPDNLPKSDEAAVLRGKLPKELIQVRLVSEGNVIKNLTQPILVTVQLPDNCQL